ncbi:MAG: glycosyltransferase family 2 protein [Bacteroidales bacterium]
MNLYFSVILPAYNTPPEILRRAINSVLNQTYPYFELIVVDDGSEPSLESIVRAYKDERIVFIRHPENKGAGAAHNTGIKAAKYEWIAFICHDDEWLKEKLEIQKEFIEKYSDYKFFYSGEYYVEKGNIVANKFISYKYSQDISDYENILIKVFLNTSTIVIHKEVFDKVGYYDETGVLIDWDLYIRIFKNYKIYYIPQPLIYYYYSELGISHINTIHKGERVGNDIIKLFYKWKHEIKKYKLARKSWASLLYWVVNYFLEEKQRKNYVKIYWEIIKLYPFWRGYYIDLIKYLFLSPLQKNINKIIRTKLNNLLY